MWVSPQAEGLEGRWDQQRGLDMLPEEPVFSDEDLEPPSDRDLLADGLWNKMTESDSDQDSIRSASPMFAFEPESGDNDGEAIARNVFLGHPHKHNQEPGL